MIHLEQIVDADARTVTWKLHETDPEHDIGGVMCHAMDEAVYTTEQRALMYHLGYRLVAAHVGMYGHLTYYWAKRP